MKIFIMTFLFSVLTWAQTDNGLTYAGGTFIAPNEHHDRVYETELKNRDGVMVSVGTFRALARVAMGRFDELLIVDIDRTVTELNVHNFDLISESANHFDYLTKFLNRQADPAIYEQYLKGAITPEQMLKAVMKSPKLDPQTLSPSLKAIHKIMRQPHPDYKNVADSVIKSFLELSRTTSFSAHIFGSDAVFNKVKSMIAQGKIKAVTYDITTAPLEHIVPKGKKISVLDMSNVFYYLSEANMKDMVQTIRRWPLEAKARIFITLNESVWTMGARSTDAPKVLQKSLSQYSDGWGYFSFDLTELVNEVASKAMKNQRQFGNLVAKLFQDQKRPMCSKLF